MARLMHAFAVAVAVAASGSQELGRQPEATAGERAEFDDFVRRFDKVYDTDAERESRFAIFRANLATIRSENAKDHSYTLRVTQFTDLTPEEFGQLFHSPPPPLQTDALGVHRYSGAALPDSVNWAKEGAVTDIKDQSTCGSCWSFASTGALEGAWKIATGKLVPLSEQQLVDCTYHFPNSQNGNNGCEGGAVEYAMLYFINKMEGVCTEESYPYQAALGTCNSTATCDLGIPKGGVVSYKRVELDEDDKSLMEAVSLQPVAVAIEADKKVFQNYGGGVIGKHCGTSIDHGVLLVGYGTDEKRGDYWILKNSWGDKWGENGFVRIARGVTGEGECGIKTDPVYPEVNPNPIGILGAVVAFAIIIAIAVCFGCCLISTVRMMRKICKKLFASREGIEEPLAGEQS